MFGNSARYRMGIVLIMLVLMALIAAACGSTTNKQGGEPEPTSAAQETAGAPQETEDASPEEEQADQTNQADSAGESRSFTHPFGTIELPEDPKRIVGVYLDDFLLTLGIKPLTQTMYGQRVLPYLQDLIGDLPAISPGSINLELILEEQPDLILLAYPFYAEEGRYELFSAIAPTYVFTGEEGWRETLGIVADIVGKKEVGESWLQDYDKKAAEARERLQAEMNGETVMFIRFSRAERIVIEGGPGSFSGNVLYQDLGLQPSELVKTLAWEEGSVVISAEIIPDFDADHIFITYDKPDSEDTEAFKNNPLWQSIPAVQKGNVYEMDMFHWMNDGPIAYSKKIDDVIAALLEE